MICSGKIIVTSCTGSSFTAVGGSNNGIPDCKLKPHNRIMKAIAWITNDPTSPA
jgi:hypothetical protein